MAGHFDDLPDSELLAALKVCDRFGDYQDDEFANLIPYIRTQAAAGVHYPVTLDGLGEAILDQHCESCQDPYCIH